MAIALHLANASMFPSQDTFDSPGDVATAPGHKLRCQFGPCPESFALQCDLTQHEFKHTRPFKCPHRGQDFAEKRRCIQHVKAVHNLATEKDKTWCHLCDFASVRPDAVKRHLRLRHRVGANADSSPSAASERSEQRGGQRKGRNERR